jgi:hypothetical protein
MDMNQKRQLVARDIETALNDHGLNIQPHEYVGIENATVKSGPPSF